MDPGVLSLDFVFESAPFPSCHAATLLETRTGDLLCGFFAGTHERHPDVCIYIARKTGDRWGAPTNVADGAQHDGSRQPTWNPVLFQPRDGPIMLFYKVGPNPREWWGMLKTSDDDGRTWSDAQRLPDGLLGPIKNKPVQLPDGTIISPSSVERVLDPNDDAMTALGGSTPTVTPGSQGGWQVYFEISKDNGRTWEATPVVPTPPDLKAIQPSVLVHSTSTLQAIGRTKSKRMFSTWSHDAGRTWSELALLDLPNCNSGTDAVTLADGSHLLVYNHSDTEKVRYPLNVAVTTDGSHWSAAAVLEHEPPGQYSYPAVVQSAANGLVDVAYTWKRQRIRHALLDPQRLPERPILSGAWPN